MNKIYRMCISLICIFVMFSEICLAQTVAPFKKDATISLDLKGMDIVEVLKTLASKSKMNLVIGSNVRGRVTMFLKDVNIDDAFEIILAANNLASEKRGEIVYVMTQREYELQYGESYGDKREARIIQLKYAKAVEVEKILNQIKTKIGRVIIDEGSNTLVVIDSPRTIVQVLELVVKLDQPTETIVFELNYAVCTDLKEKLQEMVTKGVGMVQVDERTNKVVVTDLKTNIPRITEVVQAFDTKTQQVLIEAKIIEITLTDTYQFGVDWEAVLDDLQRRLYPVIKNPISLTGSFNLAASGALSPGVEIAVGDFSGGDYSAMVQLLKSIGDTNILSSPRITVLNNEEAKILVGSSQPYATNTVTQGTATTTTATTLTFLDVGVKLFVTPTINKNGFVTIKIRPEVSSVSGNYTYGSPSTTVPIVSTTEAETAVTVKNGRTIIIAGLIKDERSDTVKKVPFLGDIPVLGNGFKKTDNSVTKKELVIFITPHIISGETDYIKQPMFPPMGEDRFTLHEKPAFERRKPHKMDSGMFKKRYKIESKTKNVPPQISDQDEYFLFIRNKVIENLSVPQDRSRILKGDRATVSFLLYSEGNLVSKPKIDESTTIFLSRAVVKAIEEASPFPPFPASMREASKRFTLDILYDPDLKKKRKVLWGK